LTEGLSIVERQLHFSTNVTEDISGRQGEEFHLASLNYNLFLGNFVGKFGNDAILENPKLNL